MITADPVAKKAIHNPEYYVMKHFSHFVVPGSRRIGLKGPWTGDALAFETPTGDKIVVVANPFREKRTLCMSDGSAVHEFVLEPESFNTIVL
jgi:glucosylceramidase